MHHWNTLPWQPPSGPLCLSALLTPTPLAPRCRRLSLPSWVHSTLLTQHPRLFLGVPLYCAVEEVTALPQCTRLSWVLDSTQKEGGP